MKAVQPQPPDGNAVVRVRAQVMMRDDSTGGWVPMGGGGLSNVSVRKRKIHHEENDQPCKHEYLIYGKRLSDQSMEVTGEVVLSCTIKKDFEYNKVMPTFHHWKTGNKKFGLTFQTAADARAFDKGVRLAVEDLLDVNSLACPHKHYNRSGATKKGISETSPLHQYNLDVGEDDVFMQLDLPVDKPAERIHSRGTPTKSYATLGSHSPSPELSEDHPYYQLHHGITVSKSVSPPKLKATPPPRYGLAETSSFPLGPANALHGHHLHRPPNELVMSSQPSISVVTSPERSTTTTTTKLLASTTTTANDKDYSYVKFPRRLEPPHEYSYPKLIDTCKRLPPDLSQPPLALSDLSPIKKAPAPPPPLPPPASAAEEKISAAGSSNSSTTSRKSRRSLASLILPCAGGGPVGNPLDEAEDNSHAPLSPPEPPGSADNSTSMTLTCAHCRESFNIASNQRGACPLAPDDWARSAVETVTCLSCAKCLLYHCMSDAEGDYGGHPCACSNTDGSRGRRWLGLTLLSVLVPCLCCYLPLMACYKSGAACSLCGGRHQAAK